MQFSLLLLLHLLHHLLPLQLQLLLVRYHILFLRNQLIPELLLLLRLQGLLLMLLRLPFYLNFYRLHTRLWRVRRRFKKICLYCPSGLGVLLLKIYYSAFVSSADVSSEDGGCTSAVGGTSTSGEGVTSSTAAGAAAVGASVASAVSAFAVGPFSA